MFNKFYITERNKMKSNMTVFFQFIISVLGGLCDYAPGATKDLVTPLNICIHIKDASFKRAICNSEY